MPVTTAFNRLLRLPGASGYRRRLRRWGTDHDRQAQARAPRVDANKDDALIAHAYETAPRGSR